MLFFICEIVLILRGLIFHDFEKNFQQLILLLTENIIYLNKTSFVVLDEARLPNSLMSVSRLDLISLRTGLVCSQAISIYLLRFTVVSLLPGNS